VGARNCRWRAFRLALGPILLAAAAHAQDLPEAEGASAARVLLKGAPGAAVRRAVEGARLRLMEPSCQKLFSAFTDPSGQPLQARLDAMGMNAAQYVSVVVFVDGASQKACRSGDALGGTQPGSRVVALCGSAFAETERNDTRLAEAIVIHETLHSLGLGENPPSSQEITSRVLGSCQQRAAIAGVAGR
jgi:hypothetical protein